MTTLPTPIVCDMTDAPDTAVERLAEYQTSSPPRSSDANAPPRASASGSRRTGLETGPRPRRPREGLLRVLHLHHHVHGDEIWWDSSVVDDDIARQILDQLYHLPETAGEGVDTLFQRFADDGLPSWSTMTARCAPPPPRTRPRLVDEKRPIGGGDPTGACPSS